MSLGKAFETIKDGLFVGVSDGAAGIEELFTNSRHERLQGVLDALSLLSENTKELGQVMATVAIHHRSVARKYTDFIRINQSRFGRVEDKLGYRVVDLLKEVAKFSAEGAGVVVAGALVFEGGDRVVVALRNLAPHTRALATTTQIEMALLRDLSSPQLATEVFAAGRGTVAAEVGVSRALTLAKCFSRIGVAFAALYAAFEVARRGIEVAHIRQHTADAKAKLETLIKELSAYGHAVDEDLAQNERLFRSFARHSGGTYWIYDKKTKKQHDVGAYFAALRALHDPATLRRPLQKKGVNPYHKQCQDVLALSSKIGPAAMDLIESTKRVLHDLQYSATTMYRVFRSTKNPGLLKAAFPKSSQILRDMVMKFYRDYGLSHPRAEPHVVMSGGTFVGLVPTLSASGSQRVRKLR